MDKKEEQFKAAKKENERLLQIKKKLSRIDEKVETLTNDPDEVLKELNKL